jgi:hypothetical protein
MEEARQAGCIKDVGARHAAKVKTLSLFEQGHAEQQSFCAKSG